MSTTFLKNTVGTEWSVEGAPLRDDIKLGCLLVIAESVQKMAGNYESLLSNVKYYKERSEGLLRRVETEKKRNAAYRGILRRREKQRKVAKSDKQHAK